MNDLTLEKQIPFGNDRKKNKGKNENEDGWGRCFPPIPQRARNEWGTPVWMNAQALEKQIPCGNDRKKNNPVGRRIPMKALGYGSERVGAASLLDPRSGIGVPDSSTRMNMAPEVAVKSAISRLPAMRGSKVSSIS